MKMKKTTWKGLSAFLLACALLPAPYAGAAETVKAGDVYVTATRVERELQQVPMSLTVMTAEDVQKSGARTVGELLQDVPGVQINNSGGQGIKRIKLRGEDETRTLILIDGQKIVENKSMDGVPLLIDPSRIERVEVIKGPASVLYGSDALGGVVNIITKKGGQKPIEGQFWAGFNGASSGFSEGLALRGNIDGFKYAVSGSHSDQDDVRTPDGTTPHSNFRQTDASAFVSYDFSDKFTLGAGMDYFKGMYNSAPVPDVMTMPGGASTPYDFLVEVPLWERFKYYAFAELKDISEYLTRVRIDTFYQKTEKDFDNILDFRTYSMSMVSANNFNRNMGISLQSDWQLGANNYMIAGYELNYDKLDGIQNSMGAIRSIAANQLTNAVYATMETQLPYDLTLSYGMRWTHVSTERLHESKTGMGAYNHGKMDETDSRPVFNIGLIWNGIEDLALRATWAQGFRAPNLQEKYVVSGMSGSTIYGNPDLEAETSNNFEIGARWNSGAFNLDIAAFYSISDDYIAQVRTGTSGMAKTYQYQNVSKATSFGMELVTSYTFDTDYGKFTPYASATWMRREYDNGAGFKTYNTGTPALAGRYGVRWAKAVNPLCDVRLDLYGRSQTAMKYDYAPAENTPSESFGGFTTTNLSAAFDFGAEKQYTVVAELLNIFDKRYTYASSILEPGVHANLKFSMKF